MATLILVTGGTRSGKSAFAQQIAEAKAAPHCFIATCRITDDEMAQRVKKHQRERSEAIWTTVEEPIDLTGALSHHDGYSVYLIDCLTLWISNMMEHYHADQRKYGETDIRRDIDTMLETILGRQATYIFVTNEVGMGIVPENPLARQYRDLVGFCNRLLAAKAQEVILVSCGLPLYLKNTR